MAWRAAALGMAVALAGCRGCTASDSAPASVRALRSKAPRPSDPVRQGVAEISRESWDPVAGIAWPPGVDVSWAPPQPAGEGAAPVAPTDGPSLVVLAVLDTVRADRLGVCGHSRDTSPSLQRLVRQGAALSCEGVAPATWTLPTHASLFTGQPPEVHGVLAKGLALDATTPTLAGAFKARGYQTLAVVANPVVGPTTGLLRDFDHVVRASRRIGAMSGPRFGQAVGGALKHLDPERPLFVFLNVIDAHDPYPPVVPQLGWGVVRTAFSYGVADKSRDNPTWRFLRGDLPPAAAEAFAAHASDTYDAGVLQADRALGKALKIMDQPSLTRHGVRLIITSDHGELLGEHGRLRHDGPPYEPVARVPFLYAAADAGAPRGSGGVRFDGPVDIVAATWSLLLEGRPPAPGPVRSRSIGYGGNVPWLQSAVAEWRDDGEKLMWVEGAGTLRYQLMQDPAESSGAPASDAGFEAVVARHREVEAAVMAKERDAGEVGRLEALGYVE
jgi:hypothetical protein